MITLVQISDPHFGTEQPPVVEALLQLVHRLKPEAVVISGDITQRARRAQFNAARKFVDRLAVRTLMVPGNHDIPLFNIAARAMYPYAGYTRVFGADLEPSFESPGLMILCVNTTRPARHKDGELSEQQIASVSARLQSAAARQLRIVVTHQPVHVIRESDVANLLHGHEAAIRAWSHAGADIIMGGHIHLPYVRPLRESHAGVVRQTWAVQAGTSVSHRVRDGIPNSVNVIIYSPGDATCTVERWDYAGEQQRFERIDAQRLALSR